jgi:acyl carrier protein phosphodiesterase
MNLLAHTALSGDSEKILVGNFIADFVRGNRYQHFEPAIIEGILLHRQIDQFTDQHLMTRKSSARLQADYGKYSPVLVDIFYDHFLAIHFNKLTQKDLQTHTQKTYQTLNKYKDILPENVQIFLPKMISQNWLFRYSDLDGIHKALQGINKRARFATHLDQAIQNLKSEFEDFQNDFLSFFPDIWTFIHEIRLKNQSN